MTEEILTLDSKTVLVTNHIEQHSFLQSLTLHLLPGIFIVAVFILTAPLALRAGIPPLIPILGSAAVGLAFQLWHLFYEGRRMNGKLSLDGVILNRQAMSLWQYIVLALGFVFLAFLINGLTSPIGAALLSFMPWLPSWFEVRDPSMLAQYPRVLLIMTFVMYLAINGIAAPIIEELYFRGYLMPRLGHFGRWAPIIATIFFTLYHFWQTYYWITQFFSMLPIVYAVWWKRNVKLGIIIHASLNILGGLALFAFLLGQ